jgi:hypothetical protein
VQPEWKVDILLTIIYGIYQGPAFKK